METECKHKHIKKNYPFGKKSTAAKYCQDCGKSISNKEIKDRKKKRR